MPARTHFQQFEPHTLLKHAIFGYYVERWARILLRKFPKVRLVDACAGCGKDDAGNDGSPLIGIRVLDAAVAQLRAELKEKREGEVWAIEKKPGYFKKLQPLVKRPHRSLLGTLED